MDDEEEQPEPEYENPDSPPEPAPATRVSRSRPQVGWQHARAKIASRTDEEKLWQAKATTSLMTTRLSIREALAQAGVPDDRLDDMARWMRTRTVRGKMARMGRQMGRSWADLHEKAKTRLDEGMDYVDEESPGRQMGVRLTAANQTLTHLSKADPKSFAEKAAEEDAATTVQDLATLVLDGDDAPEQPPLLETDEEENDDDG